MMIQCNKPSLIQWTSSTDTLNLKQKGENVHGRIYTSTTRLIKDVIPGGYLAQMARLGKISIAQDIIGWEIHLYLQG